MTPTSRRLVCRVLAVTVIVGLCVSLGGCASIGPVTPVAVSDVTSLSGTWEGIVYLPGSERDDVTLTIRDDGSYDWPQTNVYVAEERNCGPTPKRWRVRVPSIPAPGCVRRWD
jgi:hypothetical protein